MTRFRSLLCWLLCALLVGAGVPQQQRRTCRGAAGDVSLAATATDAARPHGCCTAAESCCCPTAAHACDCAVPARQPLPEPQPQPQKQPADLAATPPVRAPPAGTPTPAAAATPAVRALAGIRTAILPHCSRQEALSVWRC